MCGPSVVGGIYYLSLLEVLVLFILIYKCLCISFLVLLFGFIWIAVCGVFCCYECKKIFL